MGTIFVMTHLFILFLLITLLFYFLRNTGRCAFRFFGYMKRKLIWNAVVVFLMEGYIEIGLSSLAVIKRWNWDPNGDFNTNMNIFYACSYLAIICLYPIMLVMLFCYNRARID